MNLINKKVTHKQFGTGDIVNQSETSIEIHFETENKKFVFPDVFGKHLTIHDEEDAKSLESIIQKKEDRRKQEELKKEEEKNMSAVYDLLVNSSETELIQMFEMYRKKAGSNQAFEIYKKSVETC